MVTLRSDSTDMDRPHSHPRMPHGRPPSAAVNPSRTATTSRRGGRTRARSPVVAAGRPMEENPSSAAAAAAAAAKAFSTSRSVASAKGRDDRTPSGPGYAPPPGYDGAYPPPHKWPSSDPSKRGAARMHYPPRYGPPHGYGGGYPPPHDYGDRRYRGEHPPPRGHPQAPHPEHGRSRYPVDYRYHSRGAGPTTPPKGSRGGTSLVLGGATPIHVPKTAAPPPPGGNTTGPPERPTRASAASVFRGRPDSNAPPMAQDESSKILMSLRTPSTSFEEKKESDGTSLQLSPSDPPKILSATQQKRAVEMFEKSPDGTKSTTHIDMNASFTLFNQSFDSFGDTYFNVDSTLHAADSFGIAQAGSVGQPQAAEEGKSPTLQANLSNSGIQGSLSKEFLGSSASGQLTLGYSPVHSFGTSPKRSGSGSMMVLGVPEHRSNSPTQVLGMYRSYSNARGPPPPRLEEPPYRGGYGYRGGPPPSGYDHYARPPPPQLPPPPSHERHAGAGSMPQFYIFLRRCRGAFTACTFLLPGLKAALLETPGDDYASPAHDIASPHDIEIARRRVESSVCAFGGNHGEVETPSESKKEKPETTSIFRDTEEKNNPSKESATVTPSSSVASPPRNYSRSKARYEEQLSGRYYENESRLSWEFEEDPPVEVSDDERMGRNSENDSNDKSDTDKDGAMFCKPADGEEEQSAPSPPPKQLKYRCKLCGQPKQNHVCPYQQSLARSIGVMVYPAVNAFTAAEPGTIAPPLAEMNNFVDVKDATLVGSGTTASQSRPTPERSTRPAMSPPKQVSPDSLRASPSPIETPRLQGLQDEKEKRGAKRPHSAMAAPEDQGDLLFVESMEIKPQQVLDVSPSANLSSPDAFTYAALPLPYAQRKRLSDNLFSLSNEVPHLTDECAVVLREAREKDMWDLAVAELITQVLVVTRCENGDYRFEGLAQYLLTLGISC